MCGRMLLQGMGFRCPQEGSVAFSLFARRCVQVTMEEDSHPALGHDAAASGDFPERQVASLDQTPGMFHTDALQKVREGISGLQWKEMQEA